MYSIRLFMPWQCLLLTCKCLMMMIIGWNMLHIYYLKSNVFCDCSFVCIRFQFLVHGIWCKVQFHFLTCVWFQNVIETAHAQNRNANRLLKLPEVTYIPVFMKIRSVLFFLFVPCIQADGQSSSGCCAELQIHLRRHFGIAQYKTPAICLFLYLNCKMRCRWMPSAGN